MKKIIDGKRYDTETATQVDVLSNDYCWSDFKFERTNIYRTKSGNWFLSGRGGPLSRWSVRVGNAATGGSGIRPIDAVEAREILEGEGNVAAIEQYFQDSLEDA